MPRRRPSFARLAAAPLLAAALAVALALSAGPARADATVDASCATLAGDLAAATSGETLVLDGLCTGSFALPGTAVTPFTLEGAPGTTSGFSGGAAGESELSGSETEVTLADLTFSGQSTDAPALELDEAGTDPTGSITLDADTFSGDAPASTASADNPPVEIGMITGGSSCASRSGTLTIEDSSFSGDTQSNDGEGSSDQGGALRVVVECGHDAITLTGDSFAANTLQAPTASGGPWVAAGGALAILNQDTAVYPQVTQSADVFAGNRITAPAGSSDDFGGGGEWLADADLQSQGDRFSANSLPGAVSGAWSWGAGLALANSQSSPCLLSTLADGVVAANRIVDGAGSDPASAQGAAIYIGAVSSCDDALVLDDSTVTQNSVTPSGSGAVAGVYGQPSDDLTLENSILDGDQGDDEVGGFDGAGEIDAAYSDLCAGGSPFTGTGNICADPRLADDGDASSADVHETSASPTIDAGLDADVPGALTSDYYGSPREVADACPIAAGTVDIGAAELQPDCVPATPAAPTAVPATTSASVSFTPPADNGYPITSYTVTAQPGGEQATGAASPITVTGLAPDTAYTFTLTATNSQGTSAASAPSAPVTTLPAAAAPALSHLALSLISFIAARSGGPTTRRHGVGTVFTYQDSEAATSTLTFYRVKLGRRRHGACLARAKSCSIFKQVGSFTHVDVAGRNSVHFSGRVDGHSLRGGLYQVRIRASLDGATGNTVKIEFDVF